MRYYRNNHPPCHCQHSSLENSDSSITVIDTSVHVTMRTVVHSLQQAAINAYEHKQLIYQGPSYALSTAFSRRSMFQPQASSVQSLSTVIYLSSLIISSFVIEDLAYEAKTFFSWPWPLTFETSSAVPTHVMTLCAKFHCIKYRDTASHRICAHRGIDNGQRDKQKINRPTSIQPSTVLFLH